MTGDTWNITTQLLWTAVPTVVIEWCVLRLMGERRSSVLWLSVAMNMVTNMALNAYLIYYCEEDAWLSAAIVGELTVTAAEAAGYYLLTRQWRQAAVYSVLCNATSLLTGLLLVLVGLLTGIDYY